MYKFKFNYYFNFYKDKSLSTANVFRLYMNIKHKEYNERFITEIYNKITNYQIQKYGSNLIKNSSFMRILKQG